MISIPVVRGPEAGVAQRRMPSAWRRIARVCWLPQRTKHAKIPVSRASEVVVAAVRGGVSIPMQRKTDKDLKAALPVLKGIRPIVTCTRKTVRRSMLPVLCSMRRHRVGTVDRGTVATAAATVRARESTAVA